MLRSEIRTHSEEALSEREIMGLAVPVGPTDNPSWRTLLVASTEQKETIYAEMDRYLKVNARQQRGEIELRT